VSRFVDAGLRRVHRLVAIGPANRPGTPARADDRPGARRAVSTGSRVVRAVVAIALPIVVAVVLLPARDGLSQSISLLMVVPVLVVAATAGAGAAVLAAVTAALAYNVLYTEPYYSLTIDDPDDIIEMIVLLIVGVMVGVIVESAQRALVSARVREREIAAITDFLDAAHRVESEALIEQARLSIEQLLLAKACTWRPGYHGTAAPVLAVSGRVTGLRGTVDERSLPTAVEIPVGTPPTEFGRFVVVSSDAEVSLEERRAAGSIAAALGRELEVRRRP
jgi:K+-sensing histidine kinase KdpD